MTDTTNCLLSAANYGSYRVKCTSIGIGEVIQASTGQSRNSRSFYPVRRTPSPMTAIVIFKDHEEFARFGNWLLVYITKASDTAGKVGSMRVTLATRGFDRVGVLRGGVTFGDRVTAVTHGMALSFVGVRDLSETDQPLISSFENAANDVVDAPYFYPAAIQLSGTQSAENAIYDTPLKRVITGGGSSGSVERL